MNELRPTREISAYGKPAKRVQSDPEHLSFDHGIVSRLHDARRDPKRTGTETLENHGITDMNIHRETYPWKNGQRTQHELAELHREELLDDKRVRADSVHVWHNPVLQVYEVEWELNR
jgi:hypothetical protein